MIRFPTVSHPLDRISSLIESVFDTEGDSLSKRRIFLAVFTYLIALAMQISLVVQSLYGATTPRVLPVALVSAIVVLTGIVLFFFEKYRQFSIYFLLAYLVIRQNILIYMHLNGLVPMDGVVTHLISFVVICLADAKKSALIVAVYVSAVLMQITLFSDIGIDSTSDKFQIVEWVSVHFLILLVAYYYEWSTRKTFYERDQALEKHRISAQEHARHMETMLENKKQLFADISHELRTPLSVLKANIEAMEDGITDYREGYTVIQRKVDHIDRLIQDIYFISKFDSQQLNLVIEKFYLTALMDELNTSFDKLAEVRGLKLSLKYLPDESEFVAATIEGDWHRLVQMFSNLLQNSIDYTDSGGKIELSVRNVHSGIEITVDDSAPGVDKNFQSKLFDRLYRRDSSRNRATGGSGLGLSICKAIVEEHAGTISVDSSLHGGLSVNCWLPLSQPATDSNLLNK